LPNNPGWYKQARLFIIQDRPQEGRMNRNTIALATVVTLLGIAITWLFTQNIALNQELLAGKVQCEQQLSQLEKDFRAEIDTLQRDILTR
jgi:hypothetical protein